MQSVLFYKKNWHNESLKQLEIATNLDSNNPKYKDAYSKLKEKMNKTDKQFKSGYTANSGAQNNANPNANRQMGEGSCDCCSMCTTWCCMNAMCNICLNLLCRC